MRSHGNGHHSPAEETIAVLALQKAGSGVKLAALYKVAQTGTVTVTSVDPNNPDVLATILGVPLVAGQTVVVDESLQYDVVVGEGIAGRLAATPGTVLALTGNPDYDEVDDSIGLISTGTFPVTMIRSVERHLFITVGSGPTDLAPGTYDFTMNSYQAVANTLGATLHAALGMFTVAVYGP